MLSKVVIEGFGLTYVDFYPCPYQIFTSMGGSEKARRLTKQEIMIQVNPNKLVDYIVMQP